VAYSNPRLLVVYGRIADVELALVSGHCPTSVAPQSERDQWWTTLGDRLSALPAGVVPLLMLDANARFVLQELLEMPGNDNADRLQRVFAEHGLDRTRAYDQYGNQRATWLPPAGTEDSAVCIDYLGWPSTWHDSVDDIGVVNLEDEHAGIDHSPVVASVHVSLVKSAQRRGGVNRAAMRTVEGREVVRGIFASAPCIPWDVHVDDHIRLLNVHFQRSLAAAFPHQQSPWLIAQCFAAWRRGQGDPDTLCQGIKRFDKAAAAHILVMRALSNQARASGRQDEAAFTRRVYAEARSDGPAAIAKQIRTVLKRGRGARAALPVVLHTSAGALREPCEVKEAFARHFAQSEQAVSMPLAQIGKWFVADSGGILPELPAS
ncbi:unnamed protein product, partial [Symbiodinium necroappetens]